ncbi:LCP family protein [Nesterenkonia populi]
MTAAPPGPPRHGGYGGPPPDDSFYFQDGPGRPLNPERARQKRNGRIVLSVMALLVIGALVAAGAYLFSLSRAYSDNVNHFPPTADGEQDTVSPPEEDRPEPNDDGTINMLLLGSDDGGGSGADENLPRVPGGGRSDTMMFINIPADRSGVNVLSIPRDLWVEVPGGYGWHKVNAPLALADPQGPWLTVATVEQLFDARIDHVMAIDLEGFTGLVEDLGGVTVNNPQDTPFEQYGYTFTPGSHDMDAEQAEAFVRHRSSFAQGDLQRVQNQQALVRAVINEAASPSTLANPVRVHDMIGTFSSHLVVDEELGSGAAGELAFSMRGAAQNLSFGTLPNGGHGYSSDGQWIFHQDESAMTEIARHIDEGTLDEYLSALG